MLPKSRFLIRLIVPQEGEIRGRWIGPIDMDFGRHGENLTKSR